MTKPSKARANRGRILVAKVGLDGHDRGARVLSQILMEEGFEVVYVGVRHTPLEVADAALREQVDVVGLSLLSGAHVQLSAAVRKALDERGLGHVPIAVGGLIPRSDAEALRTSGVAFASHPGDGAGAAKISDELDTLVAQSRSAETTSD